MNEIKTKKKVKAILMSGKPIIHIPENIYNKIKYLCTKINTTEWSGLLFYQTIKGDISKASEMVIEIKDIYLMDIGTAGATAFSYDGEIIAQAFIDNPEWIDNEYRMAMIHSHNSMGVFFSGTDVEELEDNVENYDYYLSIVVNNKMEVIAKVVWPGIEEREITLNRSFKDTLKKIINYPSTEKINEEVMFMTDCECIMEIPAAFNFPAYDARIIEINAKKVPKYGSYSKFNKNDYDEFKWSKYPDPYPSKSNTKLLNIPTKTSRFPKPFSKEYDSYPVINAKAPTESIEKFVKTLLGIRADMAFEEGLEQVNEMLAGFGAEDVLDSFEKTFLEGNKLTFDNEIFRCYKEITGKALYLGSLSYIDSFKDYIDEVMKFILITDRKFNNKYLFLSVLNEWLEDFVNEDTRLN
jgi:hypothetical protein